MASGKAICVRLMDTLTGSRKVTKKEQFTMSWNEVMPGLGKMTIAKHIYTSYTFPLRTLCAWGVYM